MSTRCCSDTPRSKKSSEKYLMSMLPLFRAVKKKEHYLIPEVHALQKNSPLSLIHIPNRPIYPSERTDDASCHGSKLMTRSTVIRKHVEQALQPSAYGR